MVITKYDLDQRILFFKALNFPGNHKKEAEKLLVNVTSLLDKLAKNNIIHKNKSANLKSKLYKHVNSLKAKSSSKSKVKAKAKSS